MSEKVQWKFHWTFFLAAIRFEGCVGGRLFSIRCSKLHRLLELVHIRLLHYSYHKSSVDNQAESERFSFLLLILSVHVVRDKNLLAMSSASSS